MFDNLKKISGTIYLVKNQFAIFDVQIPKSTVVYYDRYGNSLYFCTSYPYNYKGSSKNLVLNLICYDLDMEDYSYEVMKNNRVTTDIIWACRNYDLPRIEKVVRQKKSDNDVDYEQMMKHDFIRKGGSGGVRLLKDATYDVGEWKSKQGSEYAYQASINGVKHAYISVVGSGIKVGRYAKTQSRL